MDNITTIISLLGLFLIIALASNQIAGFLKKIKLPLITGLLLTGIICQPYILKIFPYLDEGSDGLDLNDLNWLKDLSLAFIAFAAGSELYLKEIRGQFKSILWNTVGQLVITFAVGVVGMYYIADYIPFMKELSAIQRVAVGMLAATIFVARSPSSAIAVINELRAKGPFTKTAIGVTVVKDVLVIILFTVCFSLSKTFFNPDVDFNLPELGLLLIEILTSFGLGWVLGKVIAQLFKFKWNQNIKAIVLLAVGLSVYLFAHWIKGFSFTHTGHEFYIEPLLICIIASFFVTNYSPARPEFQKVLHETGPTIYVLFFTLTGATLEVEVLKDVYLFAFAIFGIRLLGMILGSFVGGWFAGDPAKFMRLGWMPYVTQAGVGLGLAAQIATEFPAWGGEFATIIIAAIVINQVVGPPLFKYAIQKVGESHEKADTPEFDGIRDAIIFGYESQSVALARQLQKNRWQAKIVSFRNPDDFIVPDDIDVRFIEKVSLESLKELEADKAEAIVLLLSDGENFKIAELVYEHIGTKELVVRIHERYWSDKFHELGALIVDPSTAMVGLMDHLVRSPNATSLLLGMDNDQDTIDVEITDETMNGVTLRDLRLPSDIIILSIMRKGQMIISHGYTRLRVGDVVAIVGSKESLEKVQFMFSE